MPISELFNSTSAKLLATPLLGVSIAVQLAMAATAPPMLASPGRTGLANIHSWGYQLQQIESNLVATSPYDLMVIDVSNGERSFNRAELAAMQRKPDGGNRIVLAYLSIGEAEDYRGYWQRSWSNAPPDWLGNENPDWSGNFAVRYWAPQWQALMYGGQGAYLDAIVASGFDGVYLDRIDAFDVADSTLGRGARIQAMADFVSAIAHYARQKHPGFVVVGQNGEELLANPTYAAAIDGVSKEDLFFGLRGDGTINSKSELRASLDPLQRFQASGKPVFLVEYLDSPASIAVARKDAAALGAPLFIGHRDLDNARSR